MDINEYKKLSTRELQALHDKAAIPLKDNYIAIRFRYGEEVVFPWKAGIEVLNAFKQAEEIEADISYDMPRIKPHKQSYDMKIIAYDEYVRMKMLTLFKIQSDAADFKATNTDDEHPF